MNWMEDLKPEDLPGDLKIVAQGCGMDVALSLAEKMGGVQIYIRPVEKLVSRKKEEYVRKHFTGRNHKELAVATGYSVPWVYKILSKAQG